jgi:hypothetical protein
MLVLDSIFRPLHYSPNFNTIFDQKIDRHRLELLEYLRSIGT